MSPRKLTPEEAGIVRKALDDARKGAGTLGQLGAAHDLAAAGGLPGCVGELRGHILRMVAPAAKVGRRSTAADLMGDVLSGIISGCVVGHIVS